MLVGWLLICYAYDVRMLFIGRFVTGFASGLMNVAGPVYIAETTPPKVRGLFGLTFPLSMSLGVLYSYIIGMMSVSDCKRSNYIVTIIRSNPSKRHQVTL